MGSWTRWPQLSGGSGWLGSGWARKLALEIVHPVFAQRDGNLADRLWDGRQVRLVDFEPGAVTGAGELANFAEHLSVWADAGIDAEAFLARLISARANAGGYGCCAACSRRTG